MNASTADVHAPASNTAAVVTYAAITSQRHNISGIAYSYVGGTPVGGNLKIEDEAASVVFSIDIPAAGADKVYFNPMKSGRINKAMIITLAAGGSGITGKVSILGHALSH